MNNQTSNNIKQSTLDVKALILNGNIPLYKDAEAALAKNQSKRLSGESLRKHIWGKSAYNAVKGWESGTTPSSDTVASLCYAYNLFVSQNLSNSYTNQQTLKPEHLLNTMPKYQLGKYLGYRGHLDSDGSWVWDFNDTHKIYEWEIIQMHINEVLLNTIEERKPYLNTHSECSVIRATLGTANLMYSFSFKKRSKHGTVLLRSTMYVKQPVVHSAAKELYQVPYQTCISPPVGPSKHLAEYDGRINIENNTIELSMSNKEYNDKAHMIFDPSDHELYISGVFIGRLFSGALHGDVVVIEPDPVKLDMSKPDELHEFMINKPKNYEDIDAIPDEDVSDELKEYLLYKRDRLREMLK